MNRVHFLSFGFRTVLTNYQLALGTIIEFDLWPIKAAGQGSGNDA